MVQKNQKKLRSTGNNSKKVKTIKSGFTKLALADQKLQKTLRNDAVDNKRALREEELQYIMSVLRPDLYSAKIPSVLPIPTSLAATKNTLYFSTNASGCVVGALTPHADAGVFVYNNGSLVSEPTTWGSLTGSITSGATAVYGNCFSRRVVSAYLEVQCLTSDANRSGLLTIGFLPFNCFTASNFTFDTLRDQPSTKVVNLAKEPSSRCIYVPIDPSALVFTGNTSGVGLTAANFPCIAFGITGGAASTNIVARYRIVHEFVPIANLTDLCAPSLARASKNPDQSIALAAQTAQSYNMGNSISSVLKNIAQEVSSFGIDLVRSELETVPILGPVVRAFGRHSKQ